MSVLIPQTPTTQSRSIPLRPHSQNQLIDHLPSLLPREASEAFSKDLLPSLLSLKDWRNTPVWAKAEKLFQEKVATLPKSA
ncbi:hypothetical protein EYC84_004337 [Monilinia fructicola]|uniref:Uncharacterized protein n=1 Tax=Monilinia fructicola TaxID=38448 RepID=A0A5M9K3V3_MONFR|nr:hypothetical protein EYC84_004337 [Monilinia fructicola]